jgi:hypothetical protein
MMPTTLESAVAKYVRSGNPVPLEQLGQKEIRDFLDWVHEDATADKHGIQAGPAFGRVPR